MEKINIINTLIALVWMVNGLFCKVLNLEPRHHEIVAEITSSSNSKELTVLIGCLEIIMAIWVLSAVKPKLNATLQISAIAIMNIIEFIIAPHLLLWGKGNSIFALVFILFVYVNNFNSFLKLKGYAFNS